MISLLSDKSQTITMIFFTGSSQRLFKSIIDQLKMAFIIKAQLEKKTVIVTVGKVAPLFDILMTQNKVGSYDAASLKTVFDKL